MSRYLALLGDEVATVEYDRGRLPTRTWTRLDQHYRPAVGLAELILRSTSLELAHGAISSAIFLLDMNAVFEDFVVVALREALGLGPGQFPQGASGRRLALDEAGAVGLAPDLSWWQDGAPVFVGDVKYKRILAPGIRHPDLYQLLAYTVATDLDAGLLVYARGEGEPVEHVVVHAGKRLEVVSLDILGAPEQVLAEVVALAARVRAHRRSALMKRSTMVARWSTSPAAAGSS